MHDIQAAVWRLANANSTNLLHIATHDPDMIKEIVNHLRENLRKAEDKLERFENLQAAICEFLKVK